MVGKKLHLGVWHRITLSGVVGNVKGNIAQTRLGGQILDMIQLTDEEAGEFGLMIMGDKVSWQKSEEREFFFNEEQFAFLKSVVDNHQDWRAGDWKELKGLVAQMEGEL